MIGFASDIDGTLIFDGKIKEGDLLSIHQFQKAGNLFGICTGRPMAWVQNLHENLSLDFFIVTSGAVILNKDFEIIEEHAIDIQTIKAFYELYHDSQLIFQTNDPKHIYSNYKDGIVEKTIIQDIDEIRHLKVYGISLITNTDDEAYQIKQEFEPKFPTLIGFQNKNSIDITMRGCSKGMAAQVIKGIYKLDTIVGIGDSYNDIPLLQKSDRSFTFHDSPESVKKEATEIVGSIEEAICFLLSKK